MTQKCMAPHCSHCGEEMKETARDASDGTLRVHFSCACRRDNPYRHVLTDRRKKS
jgi:hypothetical protein